MPHPNRLANLKNGSSQKGKTRQTHVIPCPPRILIECWPELRERNTINRGDGIGSTGRKHQGVVTRMTTFQYLAWMFDVNEALPASMKMTDLVIGMNFSREFPHSFLTEKLLHPRKGEKYSIRYFRNMYNRGRLREYRRRHPQKRLEGPVSFRYNSNGERITSIGVSVLTPEKVAAIIRRHKPDGNFTPAELEFVMEPRGVGRSQSLVQMAKVKTPEHQDGPTEGSAPGNAGGQAASSEDDNQADV